MCAWYAGRATTPSSKTTPPFGKTLSSIDGRAYMTRPKKLGGVVASSREQIKAQVSRPLAGLRSAKRMAIAN